MKSYYFSLTKEQQESIEIVKTMMRNEFGIEISEMSSRRKSRFSVPAGKGFGDCVWRVNYKLDRIEASFSRPCWQSKTCKSGGMKWVHEDGVWCAPNAQRYADLCNIIKLTQVESIPKE